MNQLHLIVRGRVQGVGFRGFVRRHALELGLGGRVRNLPDGGLEVEGEGPRDALERLAQEVRRGPVRSRVDDVQERWSEGPPRHRAFEIGG